MSATSYAKGACQACGVHLEFPVASTGSRIQCPGCRQETELIDSLPISPKSASEDAQAPALSLGELNAAFHESLPRTPVSLFYQFGLMVVALAMVVLPLIYIAMIGVAGWGVYYWATHFSFLLNSGGSARLWLFKLIAYGGPLFAGGVLVFFMVKPLFARRPPRAQPLALNPGAEPLLFTFIARICEAVDAPFPKRIDLDCNLNASASYRRGLGSLLGNDLVLTIGLPLVAGLTLRQFAGGIAHEFGHFTQGFGMRLTYIIRTVNGWFARVIYERDAWDVMLAEWAEAGDARIAIVVGLARLGVWLSRMLLTLLMWIGHGIGCFMLRQMEYDADSYEIKLVGSDAFEDTMRRFHVLGHLLGPAYKDMRTGWNINRHLPENFPAHVLRYDTQLADPQREQLENTMGLESTGVFDTHPSNGDRIRRARQAGLPGVFLLHGPAAALFNDFNVVAKQVTQLHYTDDLGIPAELARLMPVEQTVAPAEDQPAGYRESSGVSEPGQGLRFKPRE